ncbi:MAG: Abnormal spindle-like microcephaly-assocd, ASPM-SPD-2-Hydin [Actinomycetota bacterium]|jgi:hypothetical protein|nr:Abnormal spindle-like microcephaly-assocd, ASPM-SPD-2-Hydin [Actinomycetota bacterium]
MSERKPFWSSVPGVATGVAGVVSAIVGLVGIAVQLGWIGGGDGNGKGDGSTTVSTDVGGATITTGSTASTVKGATTSPPATRQGRFVVDPTSVDIQPLQPRDVTVTVSNTGDVPLTMRAPSVTGSGADRFKATDAGCTKSAVPAGGTCQINLTFDPRGPGTYTAVLVVAAANAPEVDVGLKGNAPLG